MFQRDGIGFRAIDLAHYVRAYFDLLRIGERSYDIATMMPIAHRAHTQIGRTHNYDSAGLNVACGQHIFAASHLMNGKPPIRFRARCYYGHASATAINCQRNTIESGPEQVQSPVLTART